jgi:hypothetical protein
MTEFFGDLERFIADLYPYRWPLTFGLLLVMTAITAYGYRRGLHLQVWRHRVAVSIVGTPALAAVIVGGWYFASPLFTSKTVIEEFPFSINAEVPGGMTRSAVEETMATMAGFNQRMIEAMPGSMATSAAKIKSGDFRDQDSFHKGSGQATIYRSSDGSRLLRLENLNVTNGPDLHVLLSPHLSPDKGNEVKIQGYADLGKLKGNKGDQNYPIPDGVDIDIQKSVVIYCKPFSVVFSVAMLQNEEFPLAADAIVPQGMSRAEVEQVMGSMAEFDQEVSEAMSDAMNGDTMEAGVALAQGGMALVTRGDELSDDAMVNDGLSMIRQGSEIAGGLPTVEEGFTMTEEGIRSSDGAMVEKGVAMMEEAVADTAQQLGPVRLKSGNFRDQDSFHKGSGEATIYRGPDGSLVLRLENLDVTNGPDLHVILSPHGNPNNRNDLKTPGYVDLGKLKGNKGDQNYPIPDDVDVDAQRSVTIYCQPFHVIFSVASLQDVS